MHAKNTVFSNVTITDMNNLGYGICRIDGTVVFVRHGVTGDVCDIKIIKAAKTYSVAIITNLSSPSDKRLDSRCGAFRRCGGCRFCNISREYELQLKRSFVEAAMKKAGIDITVNPVLTDGRRERYRNKAEYPIAEDENGHLCSGFYAEKSHTVISSDDCLLSPKQFSDITREFLSLAEKAGLRAYNEISGSGILRHLYLRYAEESGEIMVGIVTAAKNVPELKSVTSALVEKFPDIKTVVHNINTDKTNVILGRENRVLYGAGVIRDKLCGLNFAISLPSFYQVNRSCAELLYSLGAEKCGFDKNDTVLDLYCGIGTIGLSVAKRVKKVIGIEIVPEAIENAKANAKANNIENAEFFPADAADARRLLNARGIQPSAVIIDPPRKGCAPEVIEYISEISPEKVLYISCNADTLARDIAVFNRFGYRHSDVTPVDMFPLTGHVECVAVLKK